jgi:hypothetical protein
LINKDGFLVFKDFANVNLEGISEISEITESKQNYVEFADFLSNNSEELSKISRFFCIANSNFIKISGKDHAGTKLPNIIDPVYAANVTFTLFKPTKEKLLTNV